MYGDLGHCFDPVKVKDLWFAPLMFATLGFGSQIPLLRAIFHGLGTQTQGYKGQLPDGSIGEQLN